MVVSLPSTMTKSLPTFNNKGLLEKMWLYPLATQQLFFFGGGGGGWGWGWVAGSLESVNFYNLST